MNTKKDTSPPEKPPGVGERLRVAREQLGLTQSAVAQRLCLKVSTVRDIEEDRFPSNLATTFIRGYIRTYARLVNIPPEELLPDENPYTPPKRQKRAGMQSFSQRKRRKKLDGWLMTITWLVVLVVIGITGLWWWQNHKVQQETPQPTRHNQPPASEEIAHPVPLTIAPLSITPAPMSAAPDTAANVAAPDTAATPARDAPAPATVSAPTATPATPATPETAAAPQAAPAPQASSSQAAPAPSSVLPDPVSTAAAITPTNTLSSLADQQNALIFNFSDSCWLEVTDHSGKKLFSGLKHKGDQLILKGAPPYSLVIGAPVAVQIHYQGKQVDLSRFNNRVARLTLSAAP